ncbi:hypothetical protein [Methylibium sp.]|uniref:hypothetical protein n=1 Tax=Methylibium sp. TaxID=2067992 RepID=UPI003D0AB18D
MLLFVTSIKLIAEIALCALAGRFLLGVLAGGRREQNFFYQLLTALTRPFTTGMRAITPRRVVDRYIPLLAFVALVWIWLFALIEKVQLCRAAPMQSLCQ